MIRTINMKEKQRRCVLYAAMSLDGLIADENGGVGWLDEFQGKGEDYGYAKFLDTIDTLVMGRTTYEQVLTFGPWPYSGKRCIVFSHQKMMAREGVEFTDKDVGPAMMDLRKGQGKNIWLVGGAKLVSSFLNAGQVDEMILSIMPRMIGKGIPLFHGERPGSTLELMRNEKIGEVVQLEYRVVR